MAHNRVLYRTWVAGVLRCHIAALFDSKNHVFIPARIGCNSSWRNLRRDFHVTDSRARLRNRLPDLPHGLEMRRKRILKVASRFFPCVTHRGTPRHVRRMGRKARGRLFDND